MSNSIKFHGWHQALNIPLRLIGIACFLISLPIALLWLLLGIFSFSNPLFAIIWLLSSVPWPKYFTYTANNLIFNIYFSKSEFQNLLIMMGIIGNLSAVILFTQKEIRHITIRELFFILALLSPTFSVSIAEIRRHLYRFHTRNNGKTVDTNSHL